MMAPTQSIISFNYLSIIDRQFRDVTQRGRAEPASVCHCVCGGVCRCVAVCGGVWRFKYQRPFQHTIHSIQFPMG